MPVAGFGAKNVVFGRHPLAAVGDGLDLGHGRGPHEDRRLGSALGHRLGHVADAVLVAESWAGRPARACSRRTVSSSTASANAPGRGGAGTMPLSVDETQGAGLDQTRDRVGAERVGGLDVEVLARAARAGGAVGQAGRGAGGSAGR